MRRRDFVGGGVALATQAAFARRAAAQKAPRIDQIIDAQLLSNVSQNGGLGRHNHARVRHTSTIGTEGGPEM
jgi:hypothetical protein